MTLKVALPSAGVLMFASADVGRLSMDKLSNWVDPQGLWELALAFVCAACAAVLLLPFCRFIGIRILFAASILFGLVWGLEAIVVFFGAMRIH